jgi:hypothetical protein
MIRNIPHQAPSRRSNLSRIVSIPAGIRLQATNFANYPNNGFDKSILRSATELSRCPTKNANLALIPLETGQFFVPKTDLAQQSSPARLNLSLIYSLVFCLRLVCPTNLRDPHTLSISQASRITQRNINIMHNTTDYRNKSQPFH